MYFKVKNAQAGFVTLGKKLISLEDTIAPRGLKTKELINVNLEIEDPSNYHTSRTRLQYAFGEFIWYLSGDLDVEAISKYAPIWDTLKDDNDEIFSNYGYALFIEKQFDSVIDTLSKDLFSRKAIVRIFDEDSIDSKDTICTLTLQFLVRENKVHMIVNMRSQDITTGYVYDIMMFSLIQKMVLLQLKFRLQRELFLGTHYHNVGSLHLYEKDLEDLKLAITQESRQMPEYDFEAYRENNKMLYIEEHIRTGKQLSENDKQNLKLKSEFWNFGLGIISKKFKYDGSIDVFRA